MILDAHKIHCIGIGGIGVSALAAFWRAQGKEVSGSDAEESEITQGLQKQGVRVSSLRDGAPSLSDDVLRPDLVVYSDAVPEDHPERVAARLAGVPEMSYAQALGQVSRQYRTIVVTGTHGKSTTTAMLGLILEAAGLDPLVLVGSKVPGWKYGNLRLPTEALTPTLSQREREKFNPSPRGRGEGEGQPWFIVEGDDYRDHFLELAPYAVVVTSIEWDHPDYFRDLAHTVESFRALVAKVPQDPVRTGTSNGASGFVVVNGDDAGGQQLFSVCHPRPDRGSTINNHEIVDPRLREGDKWETRWIMYNKKSEVFGKLSLQVPGEFNRYNATAAATCAMELGVPIDVVQKALGEFRGIWRRFEIVGERIPRMPAAANNANKGECGYIVEKDLSYRLNGLLFDVQNQLGTKFQEKHYGRALEVLLQKEGISYKKEVAFDLAFEGNKIGTFRADFVIADKILLELKATDRITREHETQLLRYIESLGLPLGMIVNFRQRPLGVVRVVKEKNDLSNSRGKRPFAPSPITIISDYAHHPTAIRETMKAAREAYPGRRLMLVYQPHQHSRTKHLFNDFVEALADAADVVIVSEIYAVKGRMEERDVNSQMLVDRIARMPSAANGANVVLYSGELEQTKKIVSEHVQPGDVVVFMGAGDIDLLARELVSVC